MVIITSVSKPWLVQKYGGTSLGKLMDTICGSIIPDYAEQHRLVVVCSALSGTLKTKGTTSLLLECIALAEQGSDDQQKIVDLVHLIRDNHLAVLDTFLGIPNQLGIEIYDTTKSKVLRECETVKKFLMAAQVSLMENRGTCRGVPN